MCLHFRIQETGGYSNIQEPPPLCTGPVRPTAVATRQRRDDRERENLGRKKGERIFNNTENLEERCSTRKSCKKNFLRKSISCTTTHHVVVVELFFWLKKPECIGKLLFGSSRR
jgi:hypothetical protein